MLGIEDAIEDWQGRVRGKQLLGRRVSKICCGSAHYAAITEHKELALWGLNHYLTGARADQITGQCGTAREACCTPRLVTDAKGITLDVACGAHHTMVLTLRGLLACGANDLGQLGLGSDAGANSYSLRQVLLPPAYQVYQVACGALHTCALTQCGSIFTWGDNSMGQVCALLALELCFVFSIS